MSSQKLKSNLINFDIHSISQIQYDFIFQEFIFERRKKHHRLPFWGPPDNIT